VTVVLDPELELCVGHDLLWALGLFLVVPMSIPMPPML
jgi:hypothetical protein